MNYFNLFLVPLFLSSQIVLAQQTQPSYAKEILFGAAKGALISKILDQNPSTGAKVGAALGLLNAVRKDIKYRDELQRGRRAAELLQEYAEQDSSSDDTDSEIIDRLAKQNQQLREEMLNQAYTRQMKENKLRFDLLKKIRTAETQNILNKKQSKYACTVLCGGYHNWELSAKVVSKEGSSIVEVKKAVEKACVSEQIVKPIVFNEIGDMTTNYALKFTEAGCYPVTGSISQAVQETLQDKPESMLGTVRYYDYRIVTDQKPVTQRYKSALALNILNAIGAKPVLAKDAYSQMNSMNINIEEFERIGLDATTQSVTLSNEKKNPKNPMTIIMEPNFAPEYGIHFKVQINLSTSTQCGNESHPVELLGYVQMQPNLKVKEYSDGLALLFGEASMLELPYTAADSACSSSLGVLKTTRSTGKGQTPKIQSKPAAKGI